MGKRKKKKKRKMKKERKKTRMLTSCHETKEMDDRMVAVQYITIQNNTMQGH